MMGFVDWKDAAIRAAKTFVAAAIPIAAPIPTMVANGDVETVPAIAITAALAGAAAVITFVWNVLLDWSRPAR